MTCLLVLLPWWMWHVIEEFREIWPLSERLFLWIHILSYIFPLAVALILRRFAPRIATHVIFALVVLALGLNTWNVIHGMNSLARDDARARIREASTFVGNQLNNRMRKTSELVVLDQAIAKIMSHIYAQARGSAFS